MWVFMCMFMLLCASLLTTFTPDTNGCFPEGLLVFQRLPGDGGTDLGAPFFSCDSCAIYMFTLTISICCFWNNQLQGPGGEAPVNRARLGFHDFGGDGSGGWV